MFYLYKGAIYKVAGREYMRGQKIQERSKKERKYELTDGTAKNNLYM